LARIRGSEAGLFELAAGGTAVGTGLNAPPNFSREIAGKIAQLTGYPFVTAPNKFAAQGSLDPMVAAMAALRGLAVALMKIANDMRWLASGPRCGLGELILPENEPGSSIMPGKVNPTQCEAMVMVCIEVIGEDNAVAFAGSQGNFELNAMRPIIINNFLHSARILGDACDKFWRFSVEGTRLNRGHIDEMLGRSLMLVTALAPLIGYDKAAAIAHKANDENLTLREAALHSGVIGSSTRRKWSAMALLEADLPSRALPFVLSVIARSAEIIGFLGLNGLFTAHIPGTSSFRQLMLSQATLR
jgi:fumarate hydratase, class II